MRRLAPLLQYLGIVAAVAGFSKFHATYADPPYDFTGSARFAWAGGFVALLSISAYGAGLPELARERRVAVWAALRASLGGALGVSVLQLLVGDALLPRFVVFSTSALLVPWFCFCAALASDGRHRDEERDRVVVVADADVARELEYELEMRAERPAQIIGVLTCEEAAAEWTGARPLVDLSRARAASVVVLDRAAQMSQRVVDQVALLHEEGVRVRTLSLFHEEWLGKLPLSELERVSLMFDIGELHRARYTRLKRLADIAVAMVGLVMLAALAPFVAAGNLLANRGPIFYRQPRVGKGGRVFMILKFRSMRAAAGTEYTHWTAIDDPRVTPFGGWLRRTHLDELPQVLNILKGDLSVVGPRPEQPHYAEELAQKLPFYQLRHLVRPGLTGWAQVKGGYAAGEHEALEKLQYEFFYLRHQGMQLDLRIIVRTIRAVFLGQGR